MIFLTKKLTDLVKETVFLTKKLADLVKEMIFLTKKSTDLVKEMIFLTRKLTDLPWFVANEAGFLDKNRWYGLCKVPPSGLPVVLTTTARPGGS